MHLGAAPPELELGGGDPSSRASRRGTPAVISLAATPSSRASRLGSSSTSPRGAPRCEIGGHDPLHLVPPGVGVLQPSGASPPRRAPARHLPGEPIAAPPRRAAAQRTVVLPHSAGPPRRAMARRLPGEPQRGASPVSTSAAPRRYGGGPHGGHEEVEFLWSRRTTEDKDKKRAGPVGGRKNKTKRAGSPRKESVEDIRRTRGSNLRRFYIDSSFVFLASSFLFYNRIN